MLQNCQASSNGLLNWISIQPCSLAEGQQCRNMQCLEVHATRRRGQPVNALIRPFRLALPSPNTFRASGRLRAISSSKPHHQYHTDMQPQHIVLHHCPNTSPTRSARHLVKSFPECSCICSIPHDSRSVPLRTSSLRLASAKNTASQL